MNLSSFDPLFNTPNAVHKKNQTASIVISIPTRDDGARDVREHHDTRDFSVREIMTHSTKSKTLALLPKFTGSLSIIGSTYILKDVVFRGGTHPTGISPTRARPELRRIDRVVRVRTVDLADTGNPGRVPGERQYAHVHGAGIPERIGQHGRAALQHVALRVLRPRREDGMDRGTDTLECRALHARYAHRDILDHIDNGPAVRNIQRCRLPLLDGGISDGMSI
jgi:hypothetical protein